MFKGWLKLHRSLLDNDLWLAETFTKGQAWVDLIGHANHRAASIWIRGNEVRVERGQLAWSELTMAKRWKWSRGKVRRYLGTLESRQMVVQQTSPLTTLLTICKYEVYQGSDTADETADGTANRTADSTADGQQTVHKQECNKNKNVENTDIPPKSPKGETVPFQEIVELYHKHLPMLPRVVNINDQRKRAMKSRWSEKVNVPSGDDVIEMKCNDLDFWARYFKRAATQPFLPGDKTEWAADFDFLLKKNKFIAVLENKYGRE